MDGARFGGLIRKLAMGKTRRQAFQGLTGSAVAGLLAHLGGEEAAAACVKPGRNGCQGPQHRKCCNGAACKEGNEEKKGRCVCAGSLTQCGSKCVNTKIDKRHCGRCNRGCPAAQICRGGRCTSKLGCKAGGSFCNKFPSIVNCPGTDNPHCVCVTDLEGIPHCSDLTGNFCSGCTSSAQCPDGFVCIPANIGGCLCNGNACIQATCDGISGSSAGLRRLMPPLRR